MGIPRRTRWHIVAEDGDAAMVGKFVRAICAFILLSPVLVWSTGNENVTPIPAATPNASSYGVQRTWDQQEIPAYIRRLNPSGMVYSGGIHSTAGSCTSSAFATDAFTSSGNRVTSDGAGGTAAINYSTAGANCNNPGSDVCWVAITGTAGTQANFTHPSGTNFLVDCTSTTRPTQPTDSAWLMMTTITNGAISGVVDLRQTNVIGVSFAADITKYGACAGCDATTNTAAFTAAVGASSLVYVPPGTFHINDAIVVSNKSFRLYGAGRGVSIIIQDTASKNGITYSSTTDTDTIEVDHLSMKAGVAAAGNAVSASWSAVASSVAGRGQFHDLDITWVTAGSHYWTNGIVLTDGWNSIIRHNTIELKPPVGQTFNAGSAISLLGESNDVLIERNFIYHAQYGLLVGGTTEGVSFAYNVVVSADIGANLSTAAAEPGKSISHNHFNTFSGGVSLDARTDMVIDNNLIFKHTSSTQNWSGIILQATATGSDWVHIHHNTLAGGGTSGTENGIVLGRSTWGHIDNNTCHDMDGTCVWLQANASTNTVANNRQNGLASTLTIHASATANVLTNNQPPDSVTGLTQNSATPSIANSATNAFITNNTNPTTITALQNGYVGQVISIRAADANTTLTHGGTIFLRNGQTYALPNGSTIVLRFDGTNWYEIGPQFPLMSSAGALLSGQGRIVVDSVVIGGGGTVTVTLTNNAVFTSNTSYKCVGTNITNANAFKIVQSSGSQFTITGTAADNINYMCAGN